MRLATGADAAAIGQIHAAGMRAAISAGLGHELPTALANGINPEAIAATWSVAIATPPTPQYFLLTATAAGQPVGFAAVAPAPVMAVAETSGTSEDVVASPLLEKPADAIVLAFEIAAEHQRQGHGSRLLAACVDHLRARNARRVMTWVVSGDEARTRFWAQAGFHPAGLRRTLEVGPEKMVEDCWYADLTEDAEDA